MRSRLLAHIQQYIQSVLSVVSGVGARYVSRYGPGELLVYGREEWKSHAPTPMARVWLGFARLDRPTLNLTTFDHVLRLSLSAAPVHGWGDLDFSLAFETSDAVRSPKAC